RRGMLIHALEHLLNDAHGCRLADAFLMKDLSRDFQAGVIHRQPEAVNSRIEVNLVPEVISTVCLFGDNIIRINLAAIAQLGLKIGVSLSHRIAANSASLCVPELFRGM